MRKIALAAAMIGVLVMPAFAQAPPAGTPTRIRGTVAKLNGQTLMVKSREGPVLNIASAPGGRVLKVSYKGGTSEVVVPTTAPVVTFGPGDTKLLKPGAAVFLIALRAPDGSLTAARVTAEKNGVKPPM